MYLLAWNSLYAVTPKGLHHLGASRFTFCPFAWTPFRWRSAFLSAICFAPSDPWGFPSCQQAAKHRRSTPKGLARLARSVCELLSDKIQLLTLVFYDSCQLFVLHLRCIPPRVCWLWPQPLRNPPEGMHRRCKTNSCQEAYGVKSYRKI